MPKLDMLPLKGRSGTTYEFRVFIWGHAFKRIPAVYVVTERRIEPGAEPVYVPVYVGHTSDLSNALSSHPREGCFIAHYANTVGVLAESNAGKRVRQASDLLEALNPPCNRIENYAL